MANGITWDDRELIANLRSFDSRVNRAIAAAMKFHATRARAYARTNAPWTDRTSNARNGLFAKAQSSGGSHRIIVGHTVPYGVWLEVRWSGRYAIIRPTIDQEGPQVMQTVSQLYSRMS